MNAELALLSALLMNPEELDEIQLSPNAFLEPKHSKIYSAILELDKQSAPINIVSVGAKVPSLKDYVFSITDRIFAGGSAGFFADQVHEAYVKRELVTIMQSVASKQDQPAEALLDMAKKQLNDLTAGQSSLKSLSQLYDQTLDGMKNPPGMVPCDFPQLARIIQGYRNGAMYVVAARPGVGKTIFGLETAYQMAQHGAVLYFSMEMGDTELVKRLLSSVTSVLASQISINDLEDQDWKRLEVKREDFTRQLYIDDKPSINVNYMRSQFRKLSRETEVKAIVIDYLGLMSDTERTKNRYEKVTNISNALKQLARELKVPIIALHQLNREVENRLSARPTLADLRDSGAIEQDADVVMLLHRERDKETNLMDNTLFLGVAKNRHGAQDGCQFKLHPDYVRIANA
jgi:replicative DNA helicase